MTTREFSLDETLFCVTRALGRRIYPGRAPNALHHFLTGKTPSFGDTKKYEIVTVTCGLIILNQYPQLEEPIMKSLKERGPGLDAFPSDQAYHVWLAKQEGSFGSKLMITTVSASKLREFQAKAHKIAMHNLDLCIDLSADPIDR